jgi:AmmeMemoRadiSam system protein B
MKTPSIRSAVWAGRFYPGDPMQLRADVIRYLGAAKTPEAGFTKAVIAPHAGYPYSGLIAGSAFRLFEGVPTAIERIVLLGPSHQVPFHGLALSSAAAFETPLGRAENDPETAEKLGGLSQAEVFDEAHDTEHSLEVELPFLQQILGPFKLVPLVVGEAGDREIAEVIERLWGGPETRFVISSDLSHYLDYDAAVSCEPPATGDCVAGRWICATPETRRVPAIASSATGRSRSIETTGLCRFPRAAGADGRGRACVIP